MPNSVRARRFGDGDARSTPPERPRSPIPGDLEENPGVDGGRR